MATDAYGAAADHAALTGLTVGDPHSQYTITLQGTAAARPAQPVKATTRYVATDTGEEWVSTGSTWLTANPTVPTAVGATYQYVTQYNPPDGTTLPNVYPQGLSHGGIASGAAGWPTSFGWGRHVTERESTEVTQTAYSNFGIVVARRWANSGAPNVWSSWVGDAAWHNVGSAGEPAFANSWVNYGSTNAVAGFRKDALGWVTLQGLIKNGTAGQPAFTLPVGWRPMVDTNPICPCYVSNNTITYIQVSTAGLVYIGGGGQAYYSLEGVRFLAGG